MSVHKRSTLLLAVLHAAAMMTAVFSSPTCRRAAPCLSSIAARQKCALLPMLPGTFSAPPPAAVGYTVTRLQKHVYHYTDDAYHALLVFSPVFRRLIVVDFPRSPSSFARDGAYRLVQAAGDVLGGQAPRAVDMVYSHRHLDHIGGARIFREYLRTTFPAARVRVWATADVKARLRGSAAVATPTRVIPAHYVRSLYAGRGTRVRLVVVGGHSDTDVAAHVPPRSGGGDGGGGVLHVPDIVSVGEAPFEAFTLTTDLAAYLRAHDTLLRLPFRSLSPGHGMLGSKRDVAVSLRFALFVMAEARAAAAGIAADPAAGAVFARLADPADAAYRNGAWALREVLRLQVVKCTLAVVKEWACTLSAVDVFAESHCRAAAFFLLVDA